MFGGREAKAKEIAGQAVCTTFVERRNGSEHLLLSRPALYDARKPLPAAMARHPVSLSRRA